MKMLVIRMDEKTHSKFKARCAEKGTTMTNMIMKWINENGVENEQEKNTVSAVRRKSARTNRRNNN